MGFIKTVLAVLTAKFLWNLAYAYWDEYNHGGERRELDRRLEEAKRRLEESLLSYKEAGR
jgi:hypothetical protein